VLKAACGFVDQAHLVNDFRSMAQNPPDAFLSRCLLPPRSKR